MAENKGIDMRYLNDSRMSYPTWDRIIEKLKVDIVNLTSFGTQPIKSTNSPIYTTIKRTGVETPCGIDIPVLLDPNGKSKGLIIILGESALRTDDDITKIAQTTYNTILGTPYAIHLQKCPSKCAVYRKIFDALLEKGYSLYITDIIKVWWKGKNLKSDDTDIEIFKQEFKQFKDKKPIIVAWGKKSQDALHRLKEKEGLDTDFLPLPHPSVQNRDSWKLKILEKAIFVKKDISYATDFYEDQKASTTDEIVVKVAVADILSFAKKFRSSLIFSSKVTILPNN